MPGKPPPARDPAVMARYGLDHLPCIACQRRVPADGAAEFTAGGVTLVICDACGLDGHGAGHQLRPVTPEPAWLAMAKESVARYGAAP